ncbi:hypothetical protein K1T71_013375 [Dendrolimus kikuchii]|uniref:Uncharacterized protein n=1 Tax=Dendrolimus kikuchii TaxID=765133 RepID=A0ACC1CHX8_9NEOP|nr:hypothetical protein K1T71_013375 [Dendrolimus kikuchii]
MSIGDAYAADEECNCENMIAPDEKIWKYLKELSVDVPEEDRMVYAVLPGILSPLVGCECDENNREKRKVDPSEAPDVPESPESDYIESKIEPIVPNVHSRNCPRGHRRFGFICVPEQDLLEK